MYGFCSKLKGTCPFLRYRVRAKGRLVVKVSLVGALPWPAPGCWVMEGADLPQRSWDPWLLNKHEAIPVLGMWRRPHACPRDGHFIKAPSLTSRCSKCWLWIRPHRQRMEGPCCFGPQRAAFNELLFGIQLLSYPMGLKKKPMKPSINFDQMIGLGALSAMWLSWVAGLCFLCGPCGSCHWQLRAKMSGWDSCRTACAQIPASPDSLLTCLPPQSWADSLDDGGHFSGPGVPTWIMGVISKALESGKVMRNHMGLSL